MAAATASAATTNDSTIVVFAFVVAALAVATAIFLIVDLGDPFTGFLNMSSEPARTTLQQLAK